MNVFGQPRSSAINTTALNAIQARTNVVFDAFLDYDQSIAADPTKGKVEVMLWLAAYNVLPIGYGTTMINAPVTTAGGYNLYVRKCESFVHTL